MMDMPEHLAQSQCYSLASFLRTAQHTFEGFAREARTLAGYDRIAEQFDRQAEEAGSFALTFENAEYAEVTLTEEEPPDV